MTTRMAFRAAKQTKYRNVKTTVDGITFDSRAEAHRYSVLRILEKTGHIRNLRRQVPHNLVVNGVKIGAYISDFEYFDIRNNKEIVEDVKSTATKTREYSIKKKLMKAIFGVEITEIM